jgi:hypothetical protein
MRVVKYESSSTGAPVPTSATITIRRTASGRRDQFRAYRIVIDGQSVARVGRGQSREIEVAPGPHSVQIAIDWCTSQKALVELGAGDRVAFACEPGGSAWMGLLAITIGRRSYIALELDG